MTAHTDRPDDHLPTPNGCRWCGLAEAEHYQRWKPPIGWHGWTAPTNEQRKERMFARRRRSGREVDNGAFLLCG
jgi:hypothetical protein